MGYSEGLVVCFEFVEFWDYDWDWIEKNGWIVDGVSRIMFLLILLGDD